MKKVEILDYIEEGKENAKSGNKLRALSGLKTYREVTLLINKSRNEGNLICSNTHGYFLPYNSAEVKEFSKNIHKRIFEMKKAVKHADDFLKGSGDIEG